MHKPVIFLFGLASGFVAGGLAMLIAFPFLFPPPVVNEAAPQASASAAPAVAKGEFRFDENAPGRDPIHWANGTGAVFHTDQGVVLRLDDNFESGPGPNYWIYLNTRPVGIEEDFNADAGRVKIAALKSFTGGQNYTLPAHIDISQFHTVTIWCETFGVYIGSAVLPKT